MKKVSRLGIIGGSGVYDLPGIQNSDWIKIQTNFGEPSDKVLIGNLNNIPVAFLPRHGKNHQFSPSKINYRANIEALKICNVTKIISVSAVGSLRKDLHPGTIVLSDQFIDNTKFRKNTFFFPPWRKKNRDNFFSGNHIHKLVTTRIQRIIAPPPLPKTGNFFGKKSKN